MLILLLTSIIFTLYYPGSTSQFIIILSCLNLIFWSIPLISLYTLANKNNIILNVTEHLSLKINRWEIPLDRSIEYLNRDGNTLYLDYYPTYDSKNNTHLVKPLAYIHGWSFSKWHRSEEPEIIEFFRQQWYSVFDIWYTLADTHTHTWDIAGREVQTALSWITDNARKYNLDMSELVVAWSSAWGTLGLQAVYGGETEFIWYKWSQYVPAKKVITFFPAVNIEELWNRDTKFYGIRSRDIPYVGGTPKEYPERYAKVNIMNMLHSNLPETLIIHGESDTLIPKDIIKSFSFELTALWVENTLVTIPYAEHWFTYFSWSFGFQISKWIIKDFLK